MADGISTPETHREFFDRLEDGIFKHWSTSQRMANPSGEEEERRLFRSIRELARQREERGKDLYGTAYLDRDNIAELAEEIADAFNYAYQTDLQRVAQCGEHADIDLLLEGLRMFYEGMQHIAHYQARTLGSP